MRYTNLRPIVDTQSTDNINKLLEPIYSQHGGTLEVLVKRFLFEVGTSADDCEIVSKDIYVSLLNANKFCSHLVAKELSDIELFEDSVHFHLVDFPRGVFKKCHRKIFDILKNQGFKKVILDDYTRAGFDIWGRYGFTGSYLGNSRVKILR